MSSNNSKLVMVASCSFASVIGNAQSYANKHNHPLEIFAEPIQPVLPKEDNSLLHTKGILNEVTRIIPPSEIRESRAKRRRRERQSKKRK